jgi:hypothetical protein
MDVHIPAEITARLRARDVDVLTSQEDGTDELPDDMLLDRATELARALFTYDTDFHRIASRRLRESIHFYCVFFAEGDASKNRLYAEWLETYAKLGDPADFRNRLVYIP